MSNTALNHIKKIAGIPSFSSFEERLHPYIYSIFETIPGVREIDAPGNNLIFRLGANYDVPPIAFTAHLDKINHFGRHYPETLPVNIVENQIEGAMDDSAGLGMILTLAEQFKNHNWPDLLIFLSEMEEKKGLEEHPELLKNNGEGRYGGMGAQRIADRCIDSKMIPDTVITLDTTPLFKGDKGIALYANHWELNELKPNKKLIAQTQQTVGEFLAIDPEIKVDNNTNDYLHYGERLNTIADWDKPVVSIALEPSIYPYHQKGERVYIDDINRCLSILEFFLDRFKS